MPKVIKPRLLQRGDTVAIISPSSPPADQANFPRAVESLEKLGFKVRLGRNARRRVGFLAGTDRERAADLMAAFANPEIKAIFCMRGGHGSTRLLSMLDFELIRRNPKIFVGYSDITALHCAMLTRASMITFHGPMLNADVVTHGFPRFSRDGFFRTLTQLAAPGSIRQGYRGKTVGIIRRGMAAGRLIGGNLTMLCSLLGTPWQPSFRRKILFLEEVNEAPYRVDRMLTQLLNAGLLQQVAGIAIGICHGCDAAGVKRRQDQQSVTDVFRERLLPLGVPVVLGLPFGHVAVNATLPVGLQVTLNGNTGDLLVDEAAVC